jgi:hypothetical protein
MAVPTTICGSRSARFLGSESGCDSRDQPGGANDDAKSGRQIRRFVSDTHNFHGLLKRSISAPGSGIWHMDHAVSKGVQGRASASRMKIARFG